jgi:hypothetical protein
MVKRSKKQPDDRQDESQFVELPDNRLEQFEQTEQIEKNESQGEPVEKPKRKASARRKREQAPVPEAAPEKDLEKPDLSKEDLLDDIRQSLVAEEEVEAVEPKGFFGRIRKRLQKTPKAQVKETETLAQLDTLLETQDDLQKLVIEPKQRKREPSKNKEEEKAIQEFFADLEALADIEVEDYVPPVPEKQEVLPVEAQEAEMALLPKLPVKSREVEEVDFDAVRETALQEYDETKVEVEERKAPLQEEVRQTIRELRPFERFLLIGAGVLTVLVLLSSGVFLIANSIQLPTPTPTAVVDTADIVHPTQVTLPGGWEFKLGQGKVVDGEWNPQRAEWLVGTEISRWVALPWSLQLEAVLRTLKPEDQLEITMSNFDVLVFNVYSIRELTMEQLLASDPMTPSLLVVLYNDEEPDGTYWVVEARPNIE